MTHQRDLMGPAQTKGIRDLLQSLFVCELITPSQPLWLCFAWVTDVEVLDNTARQFASMCPDWPAAHIRLSTVMEAILDRGGSINVLIRDTKHNAAFVERVDTMRKMYGSAIKYSVRAEFHEKGMIGDTYLLDGSMNLTVSGIFSNEERVIFRCDRTTVAERHVQLREAWSGVLT